MPTTTEKKLTCCFCLHKSTPAEPVVIRSAHVGGIGDVKQAECQDRVRCFIRWDEAHRVVRAG